MAGAPPAPENGAVPLRARGILAFMGGALALTLGILALYCLATVRTIEAHL